MLRSLRTLPHISKAHYKLIAKGAGIIPFEHTAIQLRLLAIAEMLLERRRQAHLVVVKPRQIMATTCFNSMEFKMSYDIPGLRTLLLSHRGAVTNEIFQNLKRFQEQLPDGLKLDAARSNERTLAWSNLSELTVGVAGSDSARGFPCLILHLSELGRYKDRHVRDIQEGAMNAHASTEPGNMILAESTSGGEGNWFHEIATNGYRNPSSAWFTAFFGWNEMPQYRMEPPKGWAPDSEECRLMVDHNLDMQQIYWRHVKLHDHMRGIVTAFNREFPLTFEEAFQSAEGRLIDSVVMINALNSSSVIDPTQPLIMGVDPAGKGDRTAIVYRQGNVITDVEIFRKMDDVSLAHIILERVHKLNVDHVFIDMGYGHGTYHMVQALGFRSITGVHFGSTKSLTNPQLYFNKRAEMAGLFQDWIEQGPDGMGGTARIPDHKEFLQDIRMIPDLEFSGDGQKFKLATKEEIKDLLGKSPDCFDAAILTFAHPVRSKAQTLGLMGMAPSMQQGGSILTTENDWQSFSQGVQPQQANPNFRYHNFGPSHH